MTKPKFTTIRVSQRTKRALEIIALDISKHIGSRVTLNDALGAILTINYLHHEIPQSEKQEFKKAIEEGE